MDVGLNTGFSPGVQYRIPAGHAGRGIGKGGEGVNAARFGEIVTKYERLVYSICYQLTRDHHIAEDLSQETFLSAYNHIDTCPEEGLKPWLARIATNKAKDHLKSAYNRRVSAADELPEASGKVLFMKTDQPEDLAVSNDVVKLISEDIRALKEPYHKVAVLFFLEERSVEEIAGRLGRPPKTVHTQIFRAKKLLQKRLQEERPELLNTFERGGGTDGAV